MQPTEARAAAWWRRDWWAAALAAAAAVTAIDAILLQRKNNYFTGGFLSVDHLNGPLETVVFIIALWVTNLGVTGPLAALVLWLGRTWRYSSAARMFLAASLAAAPLVIADIVSYRILEFLGGAFDFALMFDLAGRSPAEIAAVAGEHVAQLVALVLAGLLALVPLVWLLNRRLPQGRQTAAPDRPACHYWWRWGLTVLLVALVVSSSLRLSHATFDNGFKRTPAGDTFGYLLSLTSDFDRDGYGLLSTPVDPAPFDARVYPWAVDWPGNGIDENGIAGDLPADFPAFREGPPTPPRFVRRPTVVLIVLESFRADLIGAMLDGQPVTPVLNELARQGISSTRAYSHNGYTVQSRFHIFSGSLANLRGGTTLIDDFKANGYQVAYFSAQDETFGSPELSVGYDRADVFYDARQDRANRYTTFATPGSLAVPATLLRVRVRSFLAGRSDTRPLFLYVNFHDTHFPYHHRLIEPLVADVVVPRAAIAPGRADDVRRMYMNTAANVDREIRRVLADVVEATGTDPAVIVTADHGESLFDEGFLGHGYALNEVQTRIPLIVRNLPVEIGEPFVQADLRDVIWRALTTERAAKPTVGLRPSKAPVLQYLGRLARPAELRVLWNADVAQVDFRRGVVGAVATTCEPDRPGRSAEQARCLAVRHWESIVLAGAGAGPVGPPP